jgi:hypothetical protein
MDALKIRFDPNDNTLIIWFDDPAQMAFLSPIEDETPGDFHLIKDADGRVIGAEFQFYQYAPGTLRLENETAALIAKLHTS